MVSFLPIALPLFAGCATGIRQALDAGRRNRRYPAMVAQLTEMRTWLAGLQTPNSIKSAVARCEEMLLEELIEWQFAVTNTGAD